MKKTSKKMEFYDSVNYSKYSFIDKSFVKTVPMHIFNTLWIPFMMQKTNSQYLQNNVDRKLSNILSLILFMFQQTPYTFSHCC